MNDDELKEIRDMCQSTSPGPWTFEHPKSGERSFPGSGLIPSLIYDRKRNFPVAHCYGSNFKDAEFIAKVRTDILNLLDEIDKLKKEILFLQ